MTATEHPIAPEDVMAFWDGELPSERAAVVSAHLAGCDVCRQVGHDLSGVSRDLSLWQVERPPVTLRPSDASAARSGTAAEPPVRRRWLAPAWLLAGVTAAAALIIAVGSFVPAGNREKAESREVPYRTASDIDFLAGAAPSQVAGDGAAQRRQGQQGQGQGQGAGAAATTGPRITRTVTLRLVVKDLDTVRPGVDRILTDVAGFLGQIDASGARGGDRSFRASVRIPAERLDAALARFKGLGEVVAESQSAEDVTEQSLDLDARLSNARNTEKRLTEVLRNRTGKVADVLEVEREIARVREVIERTDAERTNLARRVEYATLTLDIEEARKASVDFGPLPVPSRLMNALVDGTTNALESALNATLLLVRFGPVTLLWLALAGWPAFVVARRYLARTRRETLAG